VQGNDFRPRRPCVGGALIVHYEEPKKVPFFPAAAPVAKRRGRKRRRLSGGGWLVQNHGLHRDTFGGGPSAFDPNRLVRLVKEAAKRDRSNCCWRSRIRVSPDYAGGKMTEDDRPDSRGSPGRILVEGPFQESSAQR
jgi:hypothetical protein